MIKYIKIFSLLAVLVISSFLFNCKNDDDELIEDDLIENSTIGQSEKEALLFMLEEEKLARDTYLFLGNLWSINLFENIKKSEQSHMDAIENLLSENSIDFSILPAGQFENQNLQNYYNQFIADGAISQINALKIGATIEDLDIVDLEDYINATTNMPIIEVFESLQCGSRNHLRSFLSQIVNSGDTYTPQFLTLEVFDAILTASKEKCN
jgi:hypothetical protein